MAAMDEIAILLQGRNGEANRHRAGRELFGKQMVKVSFGRSGCRERTFAREFTSEDEACASVRDGAIRRCRVKYRVIDASPAALPLLATLRISNAPKKFDAAGPRLEA